MGCSRKAEKSAQSSNSSVRPRKLEQPQVAPQVEPPKTPTKEVKPSGSEKTSPLSVEKTQPDSIKFPPRKQPSIEKQKLQQQKTLKDVHEASSFVVAGEKTGDKDDFDNYLNNLGGK